MRSGRRRFCGVEPTRRRSCAGAEPSSCGGCDGRAVRRPNACRKVLAKETFLCQLGNGAQIGSPSATSMFHALNSSNGSTPAAFDSNVAEPRARPRAPRRAGDAQGGRGTRDTGNARTMATASQAHRVHSERAQSGVVPCLPKEGRAPVAGRARRLGALVSRSERIARLGKPRCGSQQSGGADARHRHATPGAAPAGVISAGQQVARPKYSAALRTRSRRQRNARDGHAARGCR